MESIHYIQFFKKTAPWSIMTKTVEASPWHREESVAVHTEMVLEEYEKRFAPHRTSAQNQIARLALLFHDVGKPSAEEVVEKKDGTGSYRRYAGHEQLSAITFTEHWLTDLSLRTFISVKQARQIRWIIEHHLPYGLKDKQKRQALRAAVATTMGDMEETFYDCLRADAAGRISDDHETKLQKVEEWIAAFRAEPIVANRVNRGTGKCYVMIGPSGSGKSTWVNKHKSKNDIVISRDLFYVQYWRDKNGPSGKPFTDAKTEYADAWKLCCIDDKEGFEAFLNVQLQHVFKTSFKSVAAQPFRNVFIDNTNGSKKARAKYIQLARNLGMTVVAVEFWNDLATLLDRQMPRPDKAVPHKSIQQQYYAQTCAWLGSEVDEVLVVPPEGKSYTI